MASVDALDDVRSLYRYAKDTLPDLFEVLQARDPRAMALLDEPAPSEAAGHSVIASPGLALVWVSALSAIVLATVSAPRFHELRSGLEAPPTPWSALAIAWAVLSGALAIACTWFSLHRPHPFPQRLVDAIDSGQPAVEAIRSIGGVEGPPLVNGELSPFWESALLRGMGRPYGSAACDLLASNLEAKGFRALAAAASASGQRSTIARRLQLVGLTQSIVTSLLAWCTYLYGALA